ncbi:unnamed protein product [Rhizoctonia solani]|uniref:RING-type domain-containing protein n=1 Tax=Rhizoctonia solani TaxID=456999 RepID=A0A8H3H7R0_9AGAM|nr:unnamed protein product [Rhizoctonia solani]
MDLFQVDQEIINDPSLEWTAQLFGQLSYHLLAPLRVPEPLDEYALNMRILGADHKRNSAEEKLKTLEAEARVLRTQVLDKEQEVARLNLNAQRKQDEVQRLKTQLARAFRPPPKEQSGFSSWFLGRSQAGESPSTSSKHKGKGLEDSVGRLVNPAGREENGISLRSSRPPTAQTSVSPKAVGSLARQRTASEEEEARSLEVAFRLQQQFDDETIQLSLAEALARSMEQPQFECRICMETCSDEDIAWVDGCEHSCCRECMRGDIQSKIEERRYPIPCPLCVAGAGGNHEQQHGIGTIPAWVVETIGISPELFNIYTEMQLAEHSIMIDCRGC